MKLFDRYVLREVLVPSLVAFLVLAVVMIVSRLFDVLVLVGGGSFYLLIALIFCAVVAVSGFVIPAAFLVGCSVAFTRLSADMEVVAARSLGISVRRMARPVLFLGAFLVFVVLMVNLYVAPWGMRGVKAIAVRMLLNRENMGVVQDAFSPLFEGVTVYAEEIKDGWMRDVLIFDYRDKRHLKVVEAEKCKITRSPDGSFVMKLKKGRITVVSDDGSSEVLLFEKMVQRISKGGGLISKPTKKELIISELFRRLERERHRKKRSYIDVLVHLHKRFSLALTPILFALIAIPLSITFHRDSRWSSLVISVVLFVGYYALLSVFQNLVYKGVPVLLSVWAPNVIYLALGLYLFIKKTDVFAA